HLPVEGGGGDVAEMVVLEGRLLGLVRERAGILLVDVVDRVLDAFPLLLQARAYLLGVDHPVSSSRRSTSRGSRPCSSTILSRAVCPETTDTAARGTRRRSASSRTTASLARPRSGAALTRTFHASPWRPASSVRAAPGETFSRRRVFCSAISPQV